MKKFYILLFVLIYTQIHAQNNVGIGTNTPLTKLDIAGDLALREGTAIAVSGASPAVAVPLTTTPDNSFYRITGAPTGTMTLNSIANGVDGQIITIVNATSIKLRISNNDAANGILTSGGATTLITPNGSFTLQYSTGAGRWFVTNAAGATLTDWIKATTTDEPAISSDAQYVTGNIGLGGHTGGAGDNTYNFANNAPNAPLVVVSPGAAAPSSTTPATGIRLTMPGTNGTKWPLSADFRLGSYATSGVNAQSQLDIVLGNLASSTPDATIMSILGNGNVGIGITTPQYKLDVNGTGLFRNGGGNTATSGNDQLLFGYNGGNSYMHGIRSRHQGGAQTGNALDFYTWNYGVDGVNALPTKFNMTINGGKVGINTYWPQGLLTIGHGLADNAATVNDGLYFKNNSDWGYAAIFAQGKAGYNGSLIFATDGDNAQNYNPTVKMEINPVGEILGKFRQVQTMNMGVGYYSCGSGCDRFMWFPLTSDYDFGVDEHTWTEGNIMIAPYAGRIVSISLGVDPSSSNGGYEVSRGRFIFDRAAALADNCCTSLSTTDGTGSYTVINNGSGTSISGGRFWVNEAASIIWKAGSTNNTLSFTKGQQVAVGMSAEYIEDNDYIITIVWEYNIDE